MVSPVYCIISGGAVHCVPVNTFTNTNTEKLKRQPLISTPLYHLAPKTLPSISKIQNRNLLYTLNNPSLSDLESEYNTNASDRRPSTASAADSIGDDESEPSRTPSKPVAFSSVLTAASAKTVTSNNDDNDLDPADSLPIKNGKIILINLDNPNDVPNGDGPDEMESLTTILGDYSTHAVYLPQYAVDLQINLDNDYAQIKTLLAKIFASWSSSDEIHVEQLTGGITNMLLACTHVPTKETLLMRVYGQGTNLIIDRHREFVSHLVLNSLHLAPPVHARFANGLIYGFLPGRSLKPADLYSPALYPLIAQQLGNWHNSVNPEYIDSGVDTLRKYTAGLKKHFMLDGSPEPAAHPRIKRSKKVKKGISNIWQLIEDWILVVPANDALAKNFNDNLPEKEVTVENVREVIFAEFDWLKSTLSKNTKSSMVVSHCDLLCGNIVVPDCEEFRKKCQEANASKKEVSLGPLEENPIRFIDYEYMLPAPRAFDIANHFAEWQGFDCNRAAIPEPSTKNEVMVKWCRGYLNNENADDKEVERLIEEISWYYGMPGFYWGIWAMIQSKLSAIDFNYADYSGLRLEEYWKWKRQFLGHKEA